MVVFSAHTPDELALALGIDLPSARRLVSHVVRKGELPERCPPTIRRVALDKVRALTTFPSLKVVDAQVSATDAFQKLLLEAPDGARIETVVIPLERAGRYSICVSSQVGCALGCTFCSTGTLGLSRNLAVWELVDQIRHAKRRLPPGGRVHGVVFQGMGEPLANVERVISAIRILSEPSADAIDMRNITVSTSGLPAGIRALTQALPLVRLGVSLGSLRPAVRAHVMPISQTHPLAEVLLAAGAHAVASGHAPMFAYTLLAGVNDSDDDADLLAACIQNFTATHGIRPRLSLIPYNPTVGLPFQRCSAAVQAQFLARLAARRVFGIVRYSGGADIEAACGQLVALRTERPQASSPVH